MDSTNSLTRRMRALEAGVPAEDCRTCAGHPVFTIGGDVLPCAECGHEPTVFSIDIDRASHLGGDVA